MEQHLPDNLLLDVGGEGAGLGPGVLGAGLLRGADLPHARLVTHLLLEHGISNTALNNLREDFTIVEKVPTRTKVRLKL